MNSAPEEITPEPIQESQAAQEPIQEQVSSESIQEPQIIEESPLTPPSSAPNIIPENKDFQATAPQVVIEKEKSFAYYVGFAFLTVLAITFFFIPGISIVYLIHQINPVNASTAWIFAAVLSVILWVLFKFKISGIVKATYIYLCFCLLIFVVLVIIYGTSQTGNIFGNILAMLTGATP